MKVDTISIPQIFSLLFSKVAPTVVVIKIDVEGYEFELLPAYLQELRTRKIDYLILFETHLKNSEMRAQFQKLLSGTVDQQVVYPKKYSGVNLLSDQLPLTQYDIAIASWKLS